MKSLRRLAALQGKVADLATLKLAQAEAAHTAVTSERDALLGLLDRQVVTGRLAVLALERTHVLAARARATDAHRLGRMEERRRAETKLKLAERASEVEERTATALAERRALERLIEEAVLRGQPE